LNKVRYGKEVEWMVNWVMEFGKKFGRKLEGPSVLVGLPAAPRSPVTTFPVETLGNVETVT
jgi:hypothetical protein